MKFLSAIITLLSVSFCCVKGSDDLVDNAIDRILNFQNCKKALREKGCDVQTISSSEDDVDICPLFLTPYCYKVIHSGIDINDVPICKKLSIDDFSQFNFMSVRYLSKLTDQCGDDFHLEPGVKTVTSPSSSATTTVIVVSPTPIITGRCGKEFGSCGEFECCSEYGYCGVSKEYCGNGCQSEFGKCIPEDYDEKKDEIPVSFISGRCGPLYGRCEAEDECCSQYGFCGHSEDHCSEGCQSEFGICYSDPVSKTNPTPTSRVGMPTATVSGRCGKQFGGICEAEDECCSQYGYCGTSDAHCGDGCQSEFGICHYGGGASVPKPSATTKKNVPTATVSGRCGKQFGGACEGEDECCSKYNYCGTSDAHCGAGCQSEFGICKNTSSVAPKPSATTRKNVPTSTVDGRCGKQFGGACADPTLCCSQYGYCSDSDEHCGAGCQSEFGVCKTVTSSPKVSTTTVIKKVTTTVAKKPIATVAGRCGKQFGGACADATLCCSRYNYCGSSANHCGTGCQSEFGVCKKVSPATTVAKKTPTTTKKAIATVKDRCGKQFGGACADATLCCSRYNYCGSTANHCGTGCQPQYGICR